MRIVMLGTRGVPAHYGGFETAVEEIGSRLADAGHEVTVYCRRPADDSAAPRTTHAGMQLVHLPCIRRKTLETLSHTALSALHVAASGTRHDVALVFNAANTFALTLLHLRGLPVAVHVDGLEWRRAKWGPAGQTFYRLSEAAAVRWADALIADSPGIQQYYRDEFDAGTALLEYGTAVIADAPTARLAEVGLERRRYHLVVARIEPENHVLEMIRAYGASGAHLPLAVVGSIPYASEYEAAVRSAAEQTPGVRMLGGVWDPELLDELYAGSASYLHGHSVGGTNPSLLRAMGAGATTIAHDNPFNREVLGDDGFFGDTVETLASAIARIDAAPDADTERRRRLVERCTRRYDWDKVAAGYADLCADLAQGVSQRGRHSGRRDPSSPWRRASGLPGTRPWAAADVRAAGPAVTIVVPTYRRPEMLRSCLEALRTQSFADFTVVVCDNAAQPEVGRVVDELADARFRWVPRESNLGILGNVWQGFTDSTTDLVMEVDDDDVLRPDALEQLVRPMLEDPSLAVCFADVDLVDADGLPLPRTHPMHAMVDRRRVPEGRLPAFDDVAARGDILMVAAVLRRRAVDWSERPDWAATAYDRYLALALSRSGGAALHVERPVIAYRIHDAADSVGDFTRQLDGAVAVLERELQSSDDPRHLRAVRDELVRTRILRIRSLFADGRRREAAGTACDVLRSPRGLRGSARFTAHYLERVLARPARRRFRPASGSA